uniref:rab9 effector protein with kelch motifs-like n=1 Tax=Myxine glutinosa TaxID=7769 RepID=UPI00358F4FA1
CTHETYSFAFTPFNFPLFLCHICQRYTLQPRGELPGARVGHTCSYIPSSEHGELGKLAVVGGAHPHGNITQTILLDLDKHTWCHPAWHGLRPRYEHTSFLLPTDNKHLWVFGGANTSGNLNSMQALDIDAGSWSNPEIRGVPPSPRTCHEAAALVGDRLFLWGGGEKGSAPVRDPKLHVFDTVSHIWSQPRTSGNPPPPRQGHTMVAVASKVLIHGGMDGNNFMNDLHSLDTQSMAWSEIMTKGDVPQGVAAHSAVSFGSRVYMFGGLGEEGLSDKLHVLDTNNFVWTLIPIRGPSPASRLDFSMCLIPWKVHEDSSSSFNTGVLSEASGKTQDAIAQLPSVEQRARTVIGERSPDENQLDKGKIQDIDTKMNLLRLSSQESRDHSNQLELGVHVIHLCFVFGGMDDKGNLFNDPAVIFIQ